jgi:hypothetical protein
VKDRKECKMEKWRRAGILPDKGCFGDSTLETKSKCCLWDWISNCAIGKLGIESRQENEEEKQRMQHNNCCSSKSSRNARFIFLRFTHCLLVNSAVVIYIPLLSRRFPTCVGMLTVTSPQEAGHPIIINLNHDILQYSSQPKSLIRRELLVADIATVT